MFRSLKRFFTFAVTRLLESTPFAISSSEIRAEFEILNYRMDEQSTTINELKLQIEVLQSEIEATNHFK